jgi:hypothetical protein
MGKEAIKWQGAKAINEADASEVNPDSYRDRKAHQNEAFYAANKPNMVISTAIKITNSNIT